MTHILKFKVTLKWILNFMIRFPTSGCSDTIAINRTDCMRKICNVNLENQTSLSAVMTKTPNTAVLRSPHIIKI